VNVRNSPLDLAPILGEFFRSLPASRGWSRLLLRPSSLIIPGPPVGEVRQTSDKNCHRSDHGTLGIVRRPVWMGL